MDGVTTEPRGIYPRPAWSDYSKVYDIILCRTATYRAMLDDLLGKSGLLPAICDGMVVLDLGCGTGNLSREILAAYPNTTLIAVDHDPTMAKIYEEKLSVQLNDKPSPGRAFFMEAEISEAMGVLLDMGIKADYAFLVNVLFLVLDPETMLRQVADGLRAGGELRLSNPYDKTDLDSLFRRFRLDLLEQNKFESLENEFNALKAFNDKQLSPMLHRFSQEFLVNTLKRSGFSKLNHVSNDHYGGQSLLISAVT
jgi:SAM-dependent methyltransferase